MNILLRAFSPSSEDNFGQPVAFSVSLEPSSLKLLVSLMEHAETAVTLDQQHIQGVHLSAVGIAELVNDTSLLEDQKEELLEKESLLVEGPILEDSLCYTDYMTALVYPHQVVFQAREKYSSIDLESSPLTLSDILNLYIEP